MNRFISLIILLAACLLLVGCGRDVPEDTTTQCTDSTDCILPGETDPDPVLLEFNYGRLMIDNRFAAVSSNDVSFTLNFDKKIFTPEDDIVLTVYVANYTGEELSFSLTEPIVSRQQLLHASLTYGDGQYSVPVTVEYHPETELEGGVYDVTVRNRKLLATTVTFHTSAYENVEESIFNQDFADTYEMRFWFGEDEYTYRAKTDLKFSPIDWEDAAVLQSIYFPDSYIRLVGDIRFTVSFDREAYGTDDDIRMRVKVENLGKEPITLYSPSDISRENYYIRAELIYGSGTAVRSNVASPSEIAGVSSTAQLKYQQMLEREIIFYTSEFSGINRSVYAKANHGRCSLRVWLLAANETYEIRIPIEHREYLPYSYHGREVPVITTVPMVTTVPEPDVTEEPSGTTGNGETTITPDGTDEPVETTESEETTTKPEVTNESAETTGPDEATASPDSTSTPEGTTDPAVTPEDPDITERPTETTGPAETTVPSSPEESGGTIETAKTGV